VGSAGEGPYDGSKPNVATLDGTTLDGTARDGATPEDGAVGGAGGGTPALTWSVDSALAEGQELTLTTDGTYDFGEGPTIAYYNDLSSYAGGTRMDTSATVMGTGCSARVGGSGRAPYVSAIVDAPYGKALEAGTSEDAPGGTAVDQVIIDTPESNEFFFSYYDWIPASRQDSTFTSDASVAEGLSQGWNLKPVWHFHTDRGGSSDFNDVYRGNPLFIVSPPYWGGMTTLNSNTPGISTNGSLDPLTYYPAQSPMLRPDRFCRQTWIRAVPYTTGTPTGSRGMFRTFSDADGLVLNLNRRDVDNYSGSASPAPYYNQHRIPGFTRGWSVPRGHAKLYAQIYLAHGANAAARVEFSDGATYGPDTKIISLGTPTSWTRSQIKVTIRVGLLGSMLGKWVHIYDEENNLVASAQLSP
jgi:hypothetical protein